MAAVIIPENLPVGYRFRPTDEELLDHYLKLKVLGVPGNTCIIPEVDICRQEPWELAQIFKENSIIPPDDKVQEWWFFCPQTPPIRRSTQLGYWKKTGPDRTIKARDNNRPIGNKKTLVFHEGRSSKGTKTDWVIHEYHLQTANLDELFPRNPTKNYVICHLKHKGNEESDFSAMQLQGGGISLMDLGSDLRQPEHNNSFPEIQAVGNSSISLADLDSDLRHYELENSFSEAVENSSMSLVDLQSELHRPEHQNSCPDHWILVDSETESSLQQDNPVQAVTSILPDTTFQSENVDFQTNLHELRNFRSPSFADHLPDEEVVVFIDESDEVQIGYMNIDQMQTQYGPMSSSNDERAVLMKSQRTQTIKSLHGVVSLDEKIGFIEDKFNELHIFSLKHMEPPEKPEIERAYSTDEESRVEKVEKLELAARNIKPECVTLDELEAKAKVGESREHSAASKLPQNNHNKGIEQATEKSNSMPNLKGTITNSTKIFMVPPLHGQTSSSHKDHATVKNRWTPTIETLQGQTSSSQNKHAMVETLQTQTIELPHDRGDVPLEEKKSFDGNDSNSSNVLPLKHMDPLEKPVTVRIYSKDEKARFFEVKKQELAARNIKPDCVLLDDSAATAKSHNEHAVLVDNLRIGTVEPLNGVAPLHKMKGFDKNKFDSLHVSSTKHMELPGRHQGVRIYCKGEQPRLEKLTREDLAARNIKSVHMPMDESIARAKHDQSSRLHKGFILEENWLTPTNKLPDGFVHLEGKKGCSENELNGWEIVSAKQTEHPKKAGNADFSSKYKDPRLEKLKMPEFSTGEISNQKVHLCLNRQPDQSHKGESNEHAKKTEPGREISISATPLTGSTTKHPEISANSSTFKIPKKFMPWWYKRLD
ncbi:hypothetical protein BT93_G0328 [Corymbia citriodora subsp. variegata]|nr:hypothetical protein BT93_G0328 [Corymbia citriodora subsp. variegata]KAF8019606.1 hypothetical protein BT93_G0328 [Corymbia citriodora subsp. variegata]